MAQIISMSTQHMNNKIGKYKRDKAWNKTRGRCYYCGVDLESLKRKIQVYAGRVENRGGWTIDHVIPKSSGGLSSIENLVPACKSCNSSKGPKLLEDYRLSVACPGGRFSSIQIAFLREIGLWPLVLARVNRKVALLRFYGEGRENPVFDTAQYQSCDRL